VTLSPLARAEFALGLRRRSPGRDRRPSKWDTGGAAPDQRATGGWYRPTHRKQDPAVDPREPGGGESGSRGNDHGWSNCTMASGAMALDFHTLGRLQVWGGDLRHRQDDQEGGTDLGDVRQAWAAYGETLTIRSGRGWSSLTADRSAGRYLVVQGQGDVPGSATFTGGHACVLGTETNQGGDWLWGDPLAGGWQWASPGAIRKWMEAWRSSLDYAMTAAHPPSTPPPTPTPEPEPDRYQEGYQDGYTAGQAQGYTTGQAQGYPRGVRDGQAQEADRTFGSWFPPARRPDPPPGVPWDALAWDQVRWAWPWPIPTAQVEAADLPATWSRSAWTAAAWDRRDLAEWGREDWPPTWGGGDWGLDSWPITWEASHGA